MIHYVENAYHAVEQQIAAIGAVSHDNLAQVGKKITQAEASLSSLLERLCFPLGDAQDYVKYHFLLVRNIFLLEDARQAYDACVAEAEQGIAVWLTPSVQEMKAGDTVTVLYTVCNTGAATATYSYRMTYPKLHATRTEESAPARGELTLGAGERATLEFAFMAREGGLLRVEVTLGDGVSHRSVDIQILGAGCYHGTTHSHCSESDGRATMAQNFHRMIQDGMLLNYTADHNADMQDHTGFERAMASIRMCGYRFAAIKGCEITVYGNNGHLLSYGNAITFTEPPRHRTPDTIDNWNRLIAQIRDGGGYSYLAHPFHLWFNFTGFATDCESDTDRSQVRLNEDILDLYTEMDGIEIINYHYLEPGTNNDYAIAYWDRMNCKGYKKYFGSGGSDGHFLKDLSSAYNGFLLEDLTPEALETAYRNGRQFVTTGPELRFCLGGKTFGETLVTQADTAELTVEAYCRTGYVTQVVLYDYGMDAADPDRAFREGVQTVLYAHGEEERDYVCCSQTLPIQPDHFYRVAVRTDDGERVAFSNPVWVSKA